MNVKKIFFFSIFLFFSIFVFIILPTNNFQVRAETCDNLSIDEKIKCLKNETEKLGSQSKTLSSQISQFDAQIRLTTLKVTQTEEKIAQLSGRIDQLEGSLEALTKAFSERVVETYKMSKVADPLFLIVSSPNLKDVFSRYSYLKKIQDADRNLLQRLQVAQNTYRDERVDQEDLQKELELQQKTLNTQKLAKKLLLDQTKNDEKKYQALLNQALAEKAAVEKALISGVKVGPVKAGDPIAMVGNSGYPSCSTGKHLHFEIRKNNSWVDPSSYISPRSVRNCQDYSCSASETPHYVNLGSGSWGWPVDNPVWATQFYGNTPYSYRYIYSGKIHTGWDLVPKDSDIIRAPSDGNLFKASEKCGSSTINIVYIEHPDSVISLYLHVQ